MSPPFETMKQYVTGTPFVPSSNSTPGQVPARDTVFWIVISGSMIAYNAVFVRTGTVGWLVAVVGDATTRFVRERAPEPSCAVKLITTVVEAPAGNGPTLLHWRFPFTGEFAGGTELTYVR